MYRRFLKSLDFASIVLNSTLLCLMGGCIEPRRPDGLDDLERRVARLEGEVRQLQSARTAAVDSPIPAGQPVPPSLQTLLDRRRQLLRIYTERHPAIKLLDLEIFEIRHSR